MSRFQVPGSGFRVPGDGFRGQLGGFAGCQDRSKSPELSPTNTDSYSTPVLFHGRGADKFNLRGLAALAVSKALEYSCQRILRQGRFRETG